MHYYKKNIGDYHKKAGRLTMLQHGAYTLLMDACYDREKFPTIDEAIDWVWASSEAEIEAVKFVIKKFFTENNGVFVQKRIEEDLDRYHETAKTNKRIALERERKRREKSTKREQSVNDGATVSKQSVDESTPNQEPLTINQEPLTINQEPLTNNQVKKETSSANANEPFEIFSYWKKVMRKTDSAKLTPKRMKAVKSRLKEGYTVDEIKQAIYGCSVTPHNMGKNDNCKVYDCLELICRSGENIERFAGNAQQQAPQQYSSVTQRNINNIQNLELDQ